MFANRSSDITTERGKEEIAGRSSALSAYLQQMDDYRKETMEVLYTNTVDRQCLPACEQDEVAFFMVCDIAQRVKYRLFFTNTIMFQACRQPLSFLPFVKEGEEYDQEDVYYSHPPPGAYIIPTTCEYCKAEHVLDCTHDCQRPKLFFRKKRPPFDSDPKRWDPVTEYELDPPPKQEEHLDIENLENISPTPKAQSSKWMYGFFGASPRSAVA